MALIVETIKKNIIKENMYREEINMTLKTASASEALFEAVLPLYESIERKIKTNFSRISELIPRSHELLNCEDFRVTNLRMIHVPDHLVGFYNVSLIVDTGEGGKAIQFNLLSMGLSPTLVGILCQNYSRTTRGNLDQRTKH